MFIFIPRRGPSALQIELVRLPHAYTELHAQASTHNNGGEGGASGAAAGADRVGHPAVCLVCGEVLDASGRGACTRHARDCGFGLGLLFLLQVGRIGPGPVGRRWFGVQCVAVKGKASALVRLSIVQ